MNAQPAANTPPPAPAPAPVDKHCANCGAPMFGPYCYACGQPEKGMIRHLASVLSDVLDTIFNVDSRIFHSLLPLYFQPGFLTNEYFAGRRVRYVTPFRLFFFLAIVAFFAIQSNLNLHGYDKTVIHDGDNHSLDAAKTPQEVQQRMAAALAGIETSRKTPGMPESAIKGLDVAEQAIHKKADGRLAYLKARQEALAKGEKPPSDPNDLTPLDFMNFGNGPWDPVKNPIRVDWLPDAGNAKLNEIAGHMRDNLLVARKNPSHLIAGLFSVLPQTLFVLMPLFAVLLKIVYIFKRRLYMEHFMVALHSHAFIFLSLFLITLLSLAQTWAASYHPWLSAPFGFLLAAMWIWMPIYLLVMQKRVYRQGWTLTVLKYCLIGFCYTIIMSLGFAGAFIASLAFT